MVRALLGFVVRYRLILSRFNTVFSLATATTLKNMGTHASASFQCDYIFVIFLILQEL